MVNVESAAAKKQLIRWVQIHLFLLLSVFTQTVHSGNIVKHLLGFDCELPFKLETGYISVDDSELFYYFVESEGNLETDPLFLWQTGGPGCTSFTGLAYGIGPLEMVGIENDTHSVLRYYPYARTKAASFIFLDAPVGTGFSYSRTQEGLTVPLITKKITEGNKKKQEPYMNIKGYLAEAPLTDMFIDQNYRVDYAHRMALISDEIYERAKINCNGNYVTFDPANTACIAAIDDVHKCVEFVNAYHILEPNCSLPSDKQKKNMYRRSLEQGIRETCDPDNDPNIKMRVCLNDERVRKALYVRKGTKGQLGRCNLSLAYNHDVLSVVPVHKELSQMDLKVLVESGDHDMAIPYLGTLKWIKSLNLSIAEEWRPWFVDNQVQGYTMQYSDKDGYRLAFATVKGAGHPALQYHRKECYYSFDRWIRNLSL